MELKDLRENIDKIDEKLVELFNERMKASKQIALLKKESNAGILNKSREKEVMSNAIENADDDIKRYAKILYSTILDISKSYQREFISFDDSLFEFIKKTIEKTPKEFPFKASVACQGIVGAYSDIAVDKLFPVANTVYFRDFDGVFNAVEKGLCSYGVLPIENSSAGSVAAVYEAMQRYKFHIAKSIKLRINHFLMGNRGSKIENIKEIISHEQALNQCSRFISGLKNVKISICENTAIAAEIVKKSERTDIFAISSRACAELYDLEISKTEIQNSDNNYTRFICISKNMEVFEGANKISIMVSLPHTPGSLYHLITKFSTLDLNLLKIESRPVLGSDFEFLFYFDFEGNIRDERVAKLLCDLENSLEQFVLLGNYSEII